MSLRNILLDISARHGINLTDDTTRNVVIHNINRAAFDLYETSEDFPGSLREEVLYVNPATTATVMSMPQEVGRPVAVTWNDQNLYSGDVSLESMYRKFQDTGDWHKGILLKFRPRHLDYPLSQDIDDMAPLTFKLKNEENTDVNIRINGETDNSASFEETVTISAFSLEALSVGNYKEVLSIEKDDYTQYNIDIIDVNSQVLGTIYNNNLSPAYYWMVFQDEIASTGLGFDSLRILYKKRFWPMIRLSDQFPAPGYDEAIYWAWVEKHYADDESKRDYVMLAVQEQRKILGRRRSAYDKDKNSVVMFDNKINKILTRLRS